MDNMEYIESYFKGDKDDVQKQQFEKKILEDVSFAEDVAFYISANGLIREQLHKEKKERFKDLYENRKVVSIKQPVTNIWKYMAAACVVIAVSFFAWFYPANKTSPQQLADKYMRQNFQTLNVTMGGRDSLQAGLNLFNSGKPGEALVIFESLSQSNPLNDNAEKYAGIASLRLQDYDKALKYFTLLEADTQAYSNPGKFYKAITLLRRNKSGDEKTAKLLLQQVINQDLEGKDYAADWLKRSN